MKKIVLTTYLMLLLTIAKAQFLDSLQLQVGTSLTAASKDYLPLWLTANRFGVISDRQVDASTHFRAFNSQRLGKQFVTDDTINRGFYLDYGIDIYNNNHFDKVLFQEAFARLKYRKVQVSVGRFKQIIGEVDHDLSSGSLGVSGNALPIPKVTFSVPEYTDFPFTKGFIQFKGQISHGWMGNDQYLKGALLHEKNIYLRLGKGKLKVYGGIQHYAVWGGHRGDSIRLDRSFKGFTNVLFVREANDGSVPTEENIAPNRAGDHRGVIEAGIEWENEEIKLSLNNQTPFDMGQGIDIRNIDRLLGFNIVNKNAASWWNKLTFEFIYTKQMNNFYDQKYRESYYNNGVYKTGWEYNDKIIGTPLFINRIRGSEYFDEVKPYNWDAPSSLVSGLNNIISNRVVGGHIGLSNKIGNHITSKSLVTYTRNYGNYMRVPYFNPEKVQWYAMNQLAWKIPHHQLTINGAVGYDWGDLTKNVGGMLGLQWNLKN